MVNRLRRYLGWSGNDSPCSKQLCIYVGINTTCWHWDDQVGENVSINLGFQHWYDGNWSSGCHGGLWRQASSSTADSACAFILQHIRHYFILSSETTEKNSNQTRQIPRDHNRNISMVCDSLHYSNVSSASLISIRHINGR